MLATSNLMPQLDVNLGYHQIILIQKFSSSSLESIHYGWRRLPLQRWRHNMTQLEEEESIVQSEKGVTGPSPLTWPSTKKSDGTKEFATTDSMDGCNVLPETQFVGTRLRVDTTLGMSVGGSYPPCGAAGERSEFNIKPPLGAPLLIFPRGYLLRCFPQVDTSARQRGFEIRVFPILAELPKAIEPNLPVFQLYLWQLGPNMWFSPTTKSLDPIVVTAILVGFPGQSLGPATCRFACNCPEPEAWTTEASTKQYLCLSKDRRHGYQNYMQ